MEREAGGVWRRRDGVQATSSGLDVGLARLRAAAGGDEAPVLLWLPEAQVLRLRLRDRGRRAAEAALALRLGADLDPAEVAWDLGRPFGDGSTALAAAWRETIAEAEAYARRWGFTPVAVTARPTAEFPDGPRFSAAPGTAQKLATPRRAALTGAVTLAGLVAAAAFAAFLLRGVEPDVERVEVAALPAAPAPDVGAEEPDAPAVDAESREPSVPGPPTDAPPAPVEPPATLVAPSSPAQPSASLESPTAPETATARLAGPAPEIGEPPVSDPPRAGRETPPSLTGLSDAPRAPETPPTEPPAAVAARDATPTRPPVAPPVVPESGAPSAAPARPEPDAPPPEPAVAPLEPGPAAPPPPPRPALPTPPEVREEARLTAPAPPARPARLARSPASGGARPAPTLPASVAGAATIPDAMPLDRTALLGVMSDRDGRRALLRLASGEFRSVRRGDVVEGWTVSQIDAEVVTLRSGGRRETIRLPR